VVLVEPSRAQSAIIRKYLEAHGIQNVVAVASGQHALQVVRTERPDAIICTLHLPDMTGVQLAQQIRGNSQASGVSNDPGSIASSRSGPGFVLISSEAESSEADTLSKCGKAVLLKKPFAPERLVEALKVVASPLPSEDSKSSEVNSGKSKLGVLRVLIVDDSSPARLHIRGVLEGLGLSRFVEAVDGARAVAAVAKDTFDLIVTDYNMPYMDGRGLVGYLKQNPATASAPIIMITTETDPRKLEAVRQMGVTVCDKSFQPEMVRKIIERLVGML
jgi:two-component system chemotaxis response regulator CheY